jgi:Transposase domain (DUF772)
MWDVTMRGGDVRTESLFSYLSCEARVAPDHPLRPIRTIVDQALTVLSPAFDQLYSDIGRPSIPPEKLLRTLLLQAFYSVRSERQLMEQLDSNLLFRWFVGLARADPEGAERVRVGSRSRWWCSRECGRGAYCPAMRSGTPAAAVIVELLEKSADADLLRETIGFAPEG